MATCFSNCEEGMAEEAKYPEHILDVIHVETPFGVTPPGGGSRRDTFDRSATLFCALRRPLRGDGVSHYISPARTAIEKVRYERGHTWKTSAMILGHPPLM